MTPFLLAAEVPEPAYSVVAPELILGGGALLLTLLVAVMRTRLDAKFYAGYTIVFATLVLIYSIWAWRDVTSTGRHSGFNGLLAHDHFALFFVVTIAIALIFGALLIERWLDIRDQRGPEWFIVAMLTSAGAMLLAASNDLAMAFVALELMSVGAYAIAGYRITSVDGRNALRSLVAPSLVLSAVFAFGASLLYGAVGTTNFSAISTFLTTNVLLHNGLFLAGLSLMLVGLAGKVGAAPFHIWKIETSVRMPLPATAFLSVVVVLGGMAVLLRLFHTALITQQADWQPIVLVLAVLSLLVGAVGGFFQRNLRRLLAFAAVAHIGFILLGLHAATEDGSSAALYYLISYAFFVMGTFAVLAFVDDGEDHEVDSYRGLARRHPLVGFAFVVLLLAQIGIPLTAGFIGKFYVVTALTEEGSYATAVFALVAAVAVAVPFLRVLAALYGDAASTRSADGETKYDAPYGTASPYIERRPVWLECAGLWIVLTLAAVFTVAAGILPESWFDVLGFVRAAASDLS